MAIIVTRATGASSKNAPLSHAELDTNFINLNDELATKQLASQKNAANGYVGLDASALIDPVYLPDLSHTHPIGAVVGLQSSLDVLTGTFSGYQPTLSSYTVVSEVSQLGLSVIKNDIVVRLDIERSFVALNSNNASMADWQELLSSAAPVESVDGQTGVVDLSTVYAPKAHSDDASLHFSEASLGLGTVATRDTGVLSGNIPLIGAGNVLPTSILPALAITETFIVVNEATQLALTVESGDVAVRVDQNKSYIAINAANASMADWQELLTPTDSVLSVDGQIGAVDLSNVYEPAFTKFTGFNKNFGDIAGTVAQGNDGRFTNARVPLPHDHDGVYEPVFAKLTSFNKNFGSIANTVTQGNDSRLSDARTPLAHTHTGVYEPVFTKLTGFNLALGTAFDTVCVGDDARLSDSRTPLAHNHAGVYEPSFAKATGFNRNIGTGTIHVAQGSHLHTGVYEPIIGTKLTAFNKNFGTAASTVSEGDHNHAGIYEPVFAKLTGFNKNIGTAGGTVAEGSHLHTGVYEPSFAKATGFNKDFGTGTIHVAQGSHLHTGVYEPVILVKNTGFNKTIGTGTLHVAAGNHTHNYTGIYEPVFAKLTGFNKAYGTVAGTVSEGDHTHATYGLLSGATFAGLALTSPAAILSLKDSDSALPENVYAQISFNHSTGAAVGNLGFTGQGILKIANTQVNKDVWITANGTGVIKANGNEVVTVAGGQTIPGITTLGPSSVIKSTGSGNTAFDLLYFKDQFNGTLGYVGIIGDGFSGPDMVVSAQASGAKLNLSAQGGVFVNGAQVLPGATETTGTYTPSLVVGGGGSLTIQTANNTLSWTRIGSMVFVTGRIIIDVATSPGYPLTMTLPTNSAFAAEGGERVTSRVSWFDSSASAVKDAYTTGGINNSSVYIEAEGVDLAATINNSDQLTFGFWYKKV